MIRLFRWMSGGNEGPKTCASCKFLEGDACRRYPPARVCTGLLPTDLNLTVWPVVRPAVDWCGDHESR